MQDMDFSKFANTTGWEVIHDGETNMYYLANQNGNRKPGFFTTRILATNALYCYLQRQKDAQVMLDSKRKAKTNP